MVLRVCMLFLTLGWLEMRSSLALPVEAKDLGSTIESLYSDMSSKLDPNSDAKLPERDVFRTAILSYCTLLESYGGKRGVRTDRFAFVDYTLPSNEKRFYTFDLKSRALLRHTFGTHGGASSGILNFYVEGEDLPYPERKVIRYGSITDSRFFSSRVGSFESELGVAIADLESYLSPAFDSKALRLNGVDPALNSNLASRAIVFHSWPYTEDEVRIHGQPPVSEGCLMFPGTEVTEEVIEELRGAPIILFHQRLIDSRLNQERYQEDLAVYEFLQQKIRERIDEMASKMSWGPKEVSTQTQFFLNRLKREWLDRAEEAKTYFAKGSRFIGKPLKDESACLKRLEIQIPPQ